MTQKLDTWLRQLASREKAPNADQFEFLKAVISRLLIEAKAEQEGNQTQVVDDPMFDMIHGVPGSGKSELIAWLREAFEDVLGWTHGVQFVCVAFQNAMAAHIQGFTVHH